MKKLGKDGQTQSNEKDINRLHRQYYTAYIAILEALWS